MNPKDKLDINDVVVLVVGFLCFAIIGVATIRSFSRLKSPPTQELLNRESFDDGVICGLELSKAIFDGETNAGKRMEAETCHEFIDSYWSNLVEHRTP